MNAERHQTLDYVSRKRLALLLALKDEWELAGRPEMIKFGWQSYDKWIAAIGIDGYEQLHRILEGLTKENFIEKHKWVNPYA